MAISQNFPEEGPTLNLNFAGSKVLDPRITFSRTSVGTYMDANGLVVTGSADEPRFDHRYVNGEIESLGLLIEEQRQNLVTYSEDWNQHQAIQNLSVGINSITAPDGTLTADKLECTSSGDNNSGFVQKLVSISTSTDEYTTSWFVKRGNTDKTYLSAALSGGTFLAVYAYVDWTTTPVTFVYDGNNGSPTNTVHPIQEYTNDWYRASISIVNNNTNTQITNRIYSSSRTSTVTGDYLYAWGSQIEIGEFPTSYIPTSGSTVTRNADNVTMTGTNFSDWYNQEQGTVYVSQKLRAVQDTLRNNLVYLIGSGGSENDYFYNPSRGHTNIFVFGDGGTNYSRFQDGTDSTDTKTAFAYDVSGDDFKPYYNGIEATTETTTNTPSATSHTQLELGAGTSAKYCGHIQQFTYYPTRLSNTLLQNLTK